MAQRVGAQRAERLGEAFALCGIALLALLVSGNGSVGEEKEGGEHASRRRIRSLITLITRPIVVSIPPSPLSGRAKSIVWPLRRRPRERSWLLMYKDAVLRLSDSIVQLLASGSYGRRMRDCFHVVEDCGKKVLKRVRVRVTFARLTMCRCWAKLVVEDVNKASRDLQLWSRAIPAH